MVMLLKPRLAIEKIAEIVGMLPTLVTTTAPKSTVLGVTVRKGAEETSVPVKLIGNEVVYPATPLTVRKVRGVLFTPGVEV